ncbi:hypothetical protein [Desulfosporosinus fructosivorans]
MTFYRSCKGHTNYTNGGRSIVLTKLTGIAEVAKRRPNEKFTALAYLINARGPGLTPSGLALGVVTLARGGAILII